MLFQEFDIAEQTEAEYFVFHLHESGTLYNNLDSILKTNKLALDDSSCRFALELSSRKLKDPQPYLDQIKRYRKQGLSSVLDLAHLASSGLFKLIPVRGGKGVKSSVNTRFHNSPGLKTH